MVLVVRTHYEGFCYFCPGRCCCRTSRCQLSRYHLSRTWTCCVPRRSRSPPRRSPCPPCCPSCPPRRPSDPPCPSCPPRPCCPPRPPCHRSPRPLPSRPCLRREG